MFFRRNKLKKQYDNQLIETVSEIKKEYYQKKRILEQSIEPSQSILMEYKILEAKYFFYIKQLKVRKIRTEKLL
ncbi:YaaL family protein [Lottiidibacillus patelloidae]|uniref:YaaL family protein n=1 Tax=Lottiidibacillus patelloidae TaxID=2670334 RepID=UPI001302EEEE|nr:YaaL family protein [Lottiidibacillus patelloidae]